MAPQVQNYSRKQRDEIRAHQYAHAALAQAIEEVRTCLPGDRANTCFRTSASIGRFVGAGHLDPGHVESSLIAAAIASGLPQREAEAHVFNGLRRGAENPATHPDNREGPTFSRQSSHTRPTPTSSLSRVPDSTSVLELWSSAVPVTDNEEVAAWCRSRALDPLDIADWDLARAISTMGSLPRWAFTKAGDWRQSGHVLLVPLFDHSGALTSLRARAVTGDGKPAKSLAPTGYQTKGLVFACPLARTVLVAGDIRWWDSPAFVISEGEIDFLTWASRHAEAASAGPAYLGISAGSWTQTLADQIPDGARVLVRTDRDAAGHRYAKQISDSLAGRCSVSIPTQEGSR